MPRGVWSEVVGQPDAVTVLSAAAEAAAAIVAGGTPAPGAMTHAWLFTGPPGSGRTEAARAFAGALQCTAADDRPGCGVCAGCHTALAGTHADVRVVAPEGLSISVNEMRALVQVSARRPTSGRWQVVIVADADRLTEGASNALLKAVEEPPDRTVFLLCAPSEHPYDVSVTIRSRCRVVRLGSPKVPDVAAALEEEGVAPDLASWSASVTGGNVVRARRLATDEQSRLRRESVLAIPLALRRPADVFTCADDLVKAAEGDALSANEDRDEQERKALETAMGAGGTGKGTASATRGAKGALKDLEKRQKSRATRTQRDSLDQALVDLAAFYRDVLVTATGSEAALNHPDRAADARTAAAAWSRESTLRRLEAVLACRGALERNVKPRIAVEAMLTTLQRG
ncbi:DNA polymerase III subunit delta' [Actinosynnema pretiosum subsp. pretiosum]|uniref:DNA-directed DNA polymerase n=3 Tax=Actinosynnema TaxID=40566 RepID=C6WFD1_ACTMD|nr:MULTISPECIES: DNA polymerase III subunit delta' [Actinosynnema]ACU34263.1 DNA-directed DNA polymerase [Actinosynnema mirum DSM 43827]ATE52131.1 DNA polymerase III subunit delta' [Actinosynnema pretiosum]AXX27639.1 DNA polymerase III delta prime subunit [Actinosynnema pretiosum subsp. pretiosum]QUF01661.1 DNA polymerase III subunit delta' [Actinosynnema pretiosum subsp. pretiosum]